MIKKPNTIVDYTHCLINLSTSILQYYGLTAEYNALESLNGYLNKKYKNIIVMVFDGLGDSIINYHSEFGILNQFKVDVIDSVLPPTTVSALNSLESATAPNEHGWLGWSLFFEQLDHTIDIFPMVDTVSHQKIDISSFNPQEYLKYESLFSKIKKANPDIKLYEIYPDNINRNEGNREEIKVKNTTELFNCLINLANEEGERFIYAYWPDIDSLIHQYGTKSALVKIIIDNIERKINELLDNIENTLVIITADHGLIDDEPVILNEYEDVLKMLKRRPDIENRCMSFNVKKEHLEAFPALFHQLFGKIYYIYTKKEVLENNLLGLFHPSKKANSFLGDYLGIAYQNKTLFYQDDEEDHPKFKANHAGATSEEIKVPLFVIQK